MSKHLALTLGILALLSYASAGHAQFLNSAEPVPPAAMFASDSAANADLTASTLSIPVGLPRMSPELTLRTFTQRAGLQLTGIASSSNITVIHAELPDTKQAGEFELERHFNAPNSLQFKSIRFTGDTFVKTNVITRLLQSEADHIQKQQGPLTAINASNYKFSYKGEEEILGRVVNVYAVKPREKRPGLFKGRIYVDPFTGSLVRAEGTLIKSPSFFVKEIQFVQDYANFDGFTFPVHLHSIAKTRVVGTAIVDIENREYKAQAAPQPETVAQNGGSN